MEELNLIHYEFLSACGECRKKNYSKQSVINAMELAKKYASMLTNAEKRQKIVEISKELWKKYQECEALEAEYRNRRVAEAERLSKLFPAVFGEQIEKLPVCNTSVLEANKIYRDNAQLVIGPFESECLAILRNYARDNNAAFRIVDCHVLATESDGSCGRILSALNENVGNGYSNEIVVYTNIEEIACSSSVTREFCRFLRMLRLNKQNVGQYLVLTKPDFYFNDIYKGVMKEFGESNFTMDFSLDQLPVIYLPLPDFETVKGHVFRTFNVTAEDTDCVKFIQRNCYLLGYEGLSELIEKGKAEDWKELAHRLTEKKSVIFDRFAHLVAFNLERILNSDWDYQLEKRDDVTIDPDADAWHPVFTVPATEYDSIDGIEKLRDDVVKIINRNDISVKLRCGWAVNHALSGGDMFNLINIEEEEKEIVLKARWAIAYAALSELMRIPHGELLFDIGKDMRMDGLCCDGGRTIRMKTDFIKSKDDSRISYGLSVLLHECFHALQHRGVDAQSSNDTDMLTYYMAHFKVSPSRIKEWAVNFGRYRNEPFDVYYDQVVEAEARIFASEVLFEFGRMNIPELD